MGTKHDLGDSRGDIILDLDGGVLHCALSDHVTEGKDVVWTLHRGDFDPRRASKPVAGGRKWRVRLPDATSGFSVRASINGVTYESRWIQHYSAASIKQYREWRKNLTARAVPHPPRIPLYGYEAPFESIAFVCHSGEESLSGLAQFVEDNGLLLEEHAGVHWPRLSVISRNGSRVDGTGTRYLFSGITRDADRLLFGADDVHAHVTDVRNLRDQIGEFHLLTWNSEEISFGHDYIGQAHLFYFEGNGILVAANGLHLLALTVRALGIKLRIDSDAAKVKFFSTSYPFETEQGTSTDFVGVQRVSVYEELRIASTGRQEQKTELWHDNSDGDFSEEFYERELEQAKKDVIDNVRIALAHPRFENVIVELSAGLDTRIIYSALTNLPTSDKVRIATRRGSEERTAAAINNLYAFPWDDLPKTSSFPESQTLGGLPATSHSVFMDGYYIEAMFKLRTNYDRPTLILTGHGGEAFSRVMSIEGYYARNYSGEIQRAPEDVGEVLDNVIRYIGNHQVWLAAGEEHFPGTLREMLGESPSAHLAKQFSDLYVSQRNPFVGGSVFRGAMSAPQWRPLQSKALFRLKSRWFQHEQDFRLQFDLIRGLNPLVSEVPYLKDVEVARKAQTFAYRPPFSLNSAIDFDDSVDSLAAARQTAAREATWLPSREEIESTKSSIREYEESETSFLNPLAFILLHAPEFEDMGMPLFVYIDRVMKRTNPRAFSKRHNIRNKLHILMQEVLLTV
ncbi:hypothetical protein F6J84_02115 [Microbacterium caowuchunii]|uniref:hypothetical protein n=1 Tax=Microbacterium caowuchunii TaxID=2614638 RepID=UPI001243B0DF|nr:hypothetical protein [Microbacterium caowuchunii]QEV99027.1 hypothetical protein F6J84_02115 [Microbacterium caowuchunii]